MTAWAMDWSAATLPGGWDSLAINGIQRKPTVTAHAKETVSKHLMIVLEESRAILFVLGICLWFKDGTKTMDLNQ